MDIRDWAVVDRRITERLLQFQKGSGGGPTLSASIPTTLPPDGAASGDLGGTYPNPTVTGLYGIPVYEATPSNGYVLTYDAAAARWYGAAGGGGGGDGNAIGTGNFGSEPGAPTTGDLFLADNTPIAERYSGAAWNHWAPLWGPLSPPVSTDFTWANQGTATATDEKGGLWLYTPSQVAGARVLYKSAPSLNYAIICGFIPAFFPLNASAAVIGIGWRQSSDGKMVMAQMYNTSILVFRIATLNGDGTYNSAYYTSGNTYNVSPIIWIKLAEDSSNRTVSISSDRVHWFQVYQVGRTDWITADQVCLSVDDNGCGQPAGMFVLDWEPG